MKVATRLSLAPGLLSLTLQGLACDSAPAPDKSAEKTTETKKVEVKADSKSVVSVDVKAEPKTEPKT